MNILLKRKIHSDNSTVGKLVIDGEFICDTLEDITRAPGVKIPGKTAIPAGTYGIIVNHSVRFDRDLPLLLNVPGFTGVRIHSGNNAGDTEGCILVGDYDPMKPDWVSNSRVRFAPLLARISEGLKKGPVTLTIED